MKKLLELFYFWLVLTVIYSVLSMFEIGPVVFLLGLFVPYGPLSFMTTAFLLVPAGNYLALVPPVLLVVSFFAADKVAVKWGIISTWSRIVFNLCWLLVLTLVTDLLTYGTWASFVLLLSGNPGNFH